jgi:hypothetical protein
LTHIIKDYQFEKNDYPHELGKAREEYESLEKSFREASEENQALKSGSDKPLPDSEAENRSPDRIDVDGKLWSVQYKEPYFRLFKKISGKLRWLHIGRKWDSEHAK